MFTAPDLRYRKESVIELESGRSIYCEHVDNQSDVTVVFINNFFVVAPMWRNYTGRVATDYSVLFFDLENQGGSSDRADAGITRHVETLYELIQELKIANVVLVGTSVSCLIAIEFSRRFPELVAGALLVGPSCTPTADVVTNATERSLANSLRNGGLGALWDHLYSFVFPLKTMLELGPTGYLGLREAFKGVHRSGQMLENLESSWNSGIGFDLIPDLGPHIEVAVGDKDALWQDGQIPQAKRALAKTRHSVRILPGLGHMPYMEDVDSFESLVLTFLGDLGAVASEGSGHESMQSKTLTVTASDVGRVLYELLEHDISQEELETRPFSEVGVESWVFTAFLGSLEAEFDFKWDWDVPSEVFLDADSVARHIQVLVRTKPKAGAK